MTKTRERYGDSEQAPAAQKLIALEQALRENERLRALCERARIALPPLLSAYGYEDDEEDVLKYGHTTLAQLNEALKELDDA